MPNRINPLSISRPAAVFLIGLGLLLPAVPPARGEESPDKLVSKSSPQNVGGLLFDMDEGVEIEKGGGGSVYVKSNRDYMRKKFNDIEKRFKSLEARVTALEKSNGGIPAPKSEPEPAPNQRRVLSN